MQKVVRIQQMLLVSVIATSLIVTPWTSFDPINIPKFLILSSTSVGFIGLLIQSRIWKQTRYRTPLVIYLLLIIQTVLIVLITKTNTIEQIFGTSGRNTGALTFIYFAILSIATVIVSDKDFLPKILAALLVAGGIDALYGLIQAVGWDPIKWTNPYSPVFGLFGNPNFHSSFMAMVGIVIFVQLFDKGKSYLRRLNLVLFFSLILLNIWQSKSIQGFLVLAVGVSVIFLAKVQLSKLSLYFKLTLGLIPLFGAIGALLDILQKSPWTPFLYQESISSRGDYWRAGWEMTKSNPLLGVGFDNFGDRYRQYRTVTSVRERGVEIVSNSAHNVFLDISSNGGFVLLFLYLAIIFLVLRAIAKFMVRNSQFDPVFFSIVAVWFGYQSQSLISVNQIGLGVWGWFLSAAIIGFDIFTNKNEKTEGSPKVVQLKVLPKAGLLLGLVIGFLTAFLPFKADMNYRAAGTALTPESLIDVTYAWPKDTQRMLSAAFTFRDNAMPAESLKVAKDIVKINPNKYLAWQTIYLNELSTEQERIFAFQKMRLLDPYNPNNK